MSAVTAGSAEVRALVAAAERAAAAGQEAEAGRLLARAQGVAPEDPLVLNALGAQTLRAGNYADARRLFERAIGQDPGNPSFWVNLASTCRSLNEPDAELAALDKALALAPRHVLALLQKASLLELGGKQKKAAVLYHAALLCLPAGPLPASITRAIQHAAEVVRANTSSLEHFLQQRLESARANLAGERLDRFDDCFGALVGRKRVYVQQPTFLTFPYLPALQFYPRELFPWLARLEAMTEEIRAELLGVLSADSAEVQPYIAYPEGTPIDQWAELNRSLRWGAYFLWREGKALPDHMAKCSQTVAALEQIPRASVRDHAPTAFFSILQPRTRIPPHTGVTNTRLTVHLPLVVPQGCRLRVGSEVREVRAGSAWVFDDTIEHEAWNDADQPRAVLIFDIWNPYLTETERELLSLMIPGISDYYDGESPFANPP